jgi:hypothetical protein
MEAMPIKIRGFSLEKECPASRLFRRNLQIGSSEGMYIILGCG